MNLVNSLPLCIFHNTLVTRTHFTLPGLETLCNQLLSWPSSWTLPWAQWAVCWSLFMTFLYSMQSFLWRASYQLGTLTQFAHPVSLHFAESSLSSVHQDFLEIFGPFFFSPPADVNSKLLLFNGTKILTLQFMHRNSFHTNEPTGCMRSGYREKIIKTKQSKWGLFLSSFYI